MLTYCTLKPACNQVQLNPKHAQKDLLRFLWDMDIVPVAYSPLGRPNMFNGTTSIIEDPLILQLAEKYSKEPTQIVLNYGLSRGYVVIPKSSQEQRQITNFASLSFQMSEEDVDAVTDKLDCGHLIFIHPETVTYNLFA